jgi:hypothetical protein
MREGICCAVLFVCLFVCLFACLRAKVNWVAANMDGIDEVDYADEPAAHCAEPFVER